MVGPSRGHRHKWRLQTNSRTSLVYRIYCIGRYLGHFLCYPTIEHGKGASIRLETMAETQDMLYGILARCPLDAGKREVSTENACMLQYKWDNEA
jgi:hypothetical protein